MMGSQTAAVKPGNQQPTKRQIKTHNWFQKTAQRRQEQQRQKQSKQQRWHGDTLIDAGALSLPQCLQDLPEVAAVTERCFLECFCGKAVLTMAMQAHTLPCVKPWDVVYGEEFDVLSHGQVLFDTVKAGFLKHIHFGTPCQSMTWARDPQLRSTEWPLGLPQLSEKQRALVSMGNELASFTVSLCELLWSVGATFSVENPELSWLWLLPAFRKLRDLPGVRFARIRFSDFQVPYEKPTLILHNVAHWHSIPLVKFPWLGPKVTLRGLVKVNGRKLFKTKVAQTYPPLLCLRLAELLGQSWGLPAGATPMKGWSFPSKLRLAETTMPLPVETHVVPNGLGALVGLNPLQHVQFGIKTCHPASVQREIDPNLLAALQFECETSLEDIHEFRSQQLRRILHAAEQLHIDREQWIHESPELLRSLTQHIHGPLWRFLIAMAGLQADDFLHDLQQGFPLIGPLPPCEGQAHPATFQAGMSVEELLENRLDRNLRVLSALKELPFSSDIGPQVFEDADLGAMTWPRLLLPDDVQQVTLTRRIPVRELRAKGWRTRVVDHESESGVNAATTPADKIEHDTLDVLADQVLHFFRAGHDVRMWKRDVSKAFRRVPIKAQHLEFAWAVWMHEGLLWVAQHRGMPFGTVSAVYAWHRVGHMLQAIVSKIFRAPVARYVDDFLGASKDLSGGVLLSSLAVLLGFPTDSAKDADQTEAMVVLGALCRVDFPTKVLKTHVEESKANKYAQSLRDMLDNSTLEPGQASKLAGRLSFAVTVSGNRVGRAYIKPFYAQAHAPLPGNLLSPWRRRSAEWFLAYLSHSPVSVRRGVDHSRPCVVTWSDAAGASRWVAAVVHVGGQFWWTRCQTSDAIWNQLLDRGDHQIGFQELLGILLVWGTFQHLLRESLWLAFVDNDGVLHALIGGAAEDLNPLPV